MTNADCRTVKTLLFGEVQNQITNYRLPKTGAVCKFPAINIIHGYGRGHEYD
jgi:hypothetical protein